MCILANIIRCLLTNLFRCFSTAVLVSLCVTSHAGDMYPFAVDMDIVSGIPASTLNATESGNGITEKDRIHVKDGHFYTVGLDLVPGTADDQRMRFWGTNLGANMLFSNDRSDYDVEKLVTRLEKMGINIVRLHGLDSNKLYTRQGIPNTVVAYNSLLDLKPGVEYPTLHQANVGDLDRLINIFKSHGIYVDLGIRVGYDFNRFGPDDCYTKPGKQDQCVPDPAATTPKYPDPQAMPVKSRPLDHFNKEMIELQKWLAEEFLTHQNIDTGVAYKDDPGIAMIEINNESSLIDSYRLSDADFITEFPPLYAEEFEQLWNDWLYNEYLKDTGKPVGQTATEWLRARWAPVDSGTAPGELISGGDFDTLNESQIKNYGESGAGTLWSIHTTDPFPINQNSTCSTVQDPFAGWGVGTLVAGAAGGQELEVTLNEHPCKDWHFQVKQLQIPLEADAAYRVSFKVRIDDSAAVNRGDIVHQVGLNVIANSSNLLSTGVIPVPGAAQFETYEFCFYSPQATTGALLQFTPFFTSNKDANENLEGGKVYFDDISIVKDEAVGLAFDEGLNDGALNPVSRPSRGDAQKCPSTPMVEKDYLGFFYDTEVDYFKGLYDYLKLDLGVQAPVTGTQATYGGLLGNKIMAEKMDFVDSHFYWDNYNRVTNPDESWYFWLNNTPMMDNPGASVIGRIVSNRSLDKPFTISEYGMPNANEFTQESPLIVASYAALQDVDAIFFFTYHTEGSGYDPRDTFTLAPGKAPWIAGGRHGALRETRRETLTHLASNIFRRGDVAAAQNVLNVHLNTDMAFDQAGLQNQYGIRFNQTWLEDPLNIQSGVNPFDARIGLSQKVGIVHEGNTPVNQETFPVPSSPYVSDTGELKWDSASAQAQSSYLTVNTQRTKAISGYIGGSTSGVPISGTDGNGQFGTVSVTSMDGAPIATSRQLLVTSIGKAKNDQWYFNLRPEGVEPCGYLECSTTLYKEPNGPVMTETNGATVQLTGAAKSITVEKLDAQGAVSVPPELVATSTIPGGYTFTVGSLADSTPWYQITSELPASYNIEMERASAITPAANGIVPDAGSSGGSFVKLQADGDATIPIPDSLFPGEYYVEFDARAREYQGPAEIEVSLSGSTVPAGTVKVPDVLGGTWQRFLVSETPLALGGGGSQSLRFAFTNDLSGTGGDREVHLDMLRLYPANAQSNADWDADGIANASDPDNDNDGLTDTDEATLGTNPYQSDSDGDGLTDSQEVAQGLNPLSTDTDSDGALDSPDNCPGTANPNQTDSDDDGLGNVCDIEQLGPLTSIAAEDGWVRESSENSNVGGSSNANGKGSRALRLGDASRDRQYKTIVSFDTSSLPAGSAVYSARLELTRGSSRGSDPYATHGLAWVDVSAGSFGGNAALTESDFEVVATVAQSAQLVDDGSLATAALDAAGRAAIEGTTKVQLRMAFELDDNGDGSNDYAGYYSSDNSNSTRHPRLLLEYTLPD